MICFVIALHKEVEELLKYIKNLTEFKIADKIAYSGNIEGTDVIIAISGIGKVSAALTTQILIDKYSPDYVFNFGTCGGTNNKVEILKYYAIEKCCQYDFDLTKLEDVPLGYIQEYDTVFFQTCLDGLDFLNKSVLASADRFTSEDYDIKSINDMGCCLCDMEGGAIAQVCKSNNVPLIMIKGISDVHGNGTQQEQFFENLKLVGKGFPNVIIKTIKNLSFNK